jgi:hypothetical protein
MDLDIQIIEHFCDFMYYVLPFSPDLLETISSKFHNIYDVLEGIADRPE